MEVLEHRKQSRTTSSQHKSWNAYKSVSKYCTQNVFCLLYAKTPWKYIYFTFHVMWFNCLYNALWLSWSCSPSEQAPVCASGWMSEMMIKLNRTDVKLVSLFMTLVGVRLCSRAPLFSPACWQPADTVVSWVKNAGLMPLWWTQLYRDKWTCGDTFLFPNPSVHRRDNAPSSCKCKHLALLHVRRWFHSV